MAEEGGGSGSVGSSRYTRDFCARYTRWFVVFRGRIFGGGGTQKIDVNIQTPSK